MKITILGYFTYKQPIGKRQAFLKHGNILKDSPACLWQDLRGHIGEVTYIEFGELNSHIIVLLNGMHYRHLPNGYPTILHDGDQISVLPPLAGG
ncbi:MAG: MoaD/ThiS family protein [Anaerolineales bacterium]